MPAINGEIQLEVSILYALYGGGAAMFLLLCAYAYVRKIRAEMKRLTDVQKWLDNIRSQATFDQKMTVVLEAVSRQIEAPTYALYIRDERFDKLILRASRYRNRANEEATTGTGLAKASGDVYQPPMTAAKQFMTANMEILKEGEVPLLVVPVSERCVIRIGPMKQLRRSTRKQLTKWLDFVRPMIDEVVQAEQVKEQSNIALASKNAIVNISRIALEEHQVLEQILPFCVNTLKVAGGCVVEERGGAYAIKATAGSDSSVAEALGRDPAALQAFRLAPGDGYVRFVADSLPSPLTEKNLNHAIIVNMGEGERYFFVFWASGARERVWMQLFLQTLVENYRQFASAQSAYLRGTGSYVSLLQALARLLDDLSPNSIGYSELMSRYSIVIARQLGMKDDEIRDVAVAAYLSHIGTIALSSELFQKEGQYTDAEYELMKLHAEVSALIVSFATGNERIASYIRHHHERMDGHGYPAGLRGAEIPAGARIIAVVQTFLAKVNGRNYRNPLTFDQSLQTLRSASGQQLDPDMVEAFMTWFSDKRRSQIHSVRSLGACSDMCCVPESICRTCPAFGRKDKNCWETEGVLCLAHGKSCDSCFVKTESQSRKLLGN